MAEGMWCVCGVCGRVMCVVEGATVCGKAVKAEGVVWNAGVCVWQVGEGGAKGMYGMVM